MVLKYSNLKFIKGFEEKLGIYIGIIFVNTDTNEINFKFVDKWDKYLKKSDEDVDITLIEEVVSSIKEKLETRNRNEEFNLEKFRKSFLNELYLEEVQVFQLDVSTFVNFMNELAKTHYLCNIQTAYIIKKIEVAELKAEYEAMLNA